jgi:hypothetical protein
LNPTLAECEGGVSGDRKNPTRLTTEDTEGIGGKNDLIYTRKTSVRARLERSGRGERERAKACEVVPTVVIKFRALAPADHGETIS